LAASPPRPEAVLGFRVGEDGKLADWGQMVSYLRELAATSDRLRVDEVGKTTEGRPFLVVTISSAANLRRLEALRRINERLAGPRGLGEDEARQLLADGKTVVSLNHGIHSTEVAAPLTSLETAYWLATSTEPEVGRILDETVILMIPAHNPDGTEKVTRWVREWPAFDSGELPFLYHHYVGHDNNRDWYMFTQQETRLTVEHVYNRWHPQIVHDLHQMSARGARMFAPPYVDPWEPNVDPALRTAVNSLGMHVAARLTAEGKRGVVVHALYDAWGPARAYPFTHGGVRLLTECASARLASPIEVAESRLEPGIGYDPRKASWNFPLPWPGGTWRLRDVVDYQLSATRAILEHAAQQRVFWLRNFLEVNRRASARSEPFAFVVPLEQRDAWAAGKLLWVLREGGVEIHRATRAFSAADRSFSAGSSVVLMQQPASGFAKMLLERQAYPDMRQYTGGPPQRPYDVTAHTLPLLLGVDVEAVPARFAADLEPLASATVPPGRVEGGGRMLALGHRTGDLLALSRLLASGVEVHWAMKTFADAGRTFPAGTLLVTANARSQVEVLARDLGLTVRAVRTLPASVVVRRPRVGLYQSWVASMDEGWTRYVFEKEVGIEYATLHDADVRAGRLRERFDAIVLADQPRRDIVSGHAAGAMPPGYMGGLGDEGIRSLRAFAEAGGTLVMLNAATEVAREDFGLPIVNALSGVKSDEFYCPGAILRVRADLSHPLAHGMDESAAVWFESSPAFDLTSGTVVARYADDEPLLSGWLLGGKRLNGKAALAEVALGQGRVVLFGFRPQYRAQSWATYVPLLNALYWAASGPPAANK
jgi:hypothetical protein